MQAIEFEADVRNFRISVPKKLAILDKKHVRLVAMFEDGKSSRQRRGTGSFIENAISNPIRIRNFSPLKRVESHAR